MSMRIRPRKFLQKNLFQFFDDRTGKILITSIIDNLMKGQSGNASQNANIMLGFEETAGIMVPGNFP